MEPAPDDTEHESDLTHIASSGLRAHDSSHTSGGGAELRIALVDSRFLVRAAVSYLLENNICGTSRSAFRVLAFSSPLEFLSNCAAPGQCVDVVVFNIGSASLCDMQVGADLAFLHRGIGALPLVVMSDRDDCDCGEALRQGVTGYIPTNVSWAIAAQAIRLVHAGGTFMPAHALLHQTKSGRAEPVNVQGNNAFTTREREVLNLMRQGKPNKVIAHLLKVSESTVKVYVRQIMKKLGASNRTHAIFLLSQSARADGVDVG